MVLKMMLKQMELSKILTEFKPSLKTFLSYFAISISVFFNTNNCKVFIMLLIRKTSTVA